MTTGRTGQADGSLEALRAGIQGRVILPGDAGYEQSRRVWNGAVDKRPAVIVQCATTEDVTEAVRFARSQGESVAVRSGGHSPTGLSIADGGITIDLSAMKDVVVDKAQRTVRAQPGLTLAELTAALQPYDMVVPTGTCSGNGIAGATLGGGIGWLDGKVGLICDNVLSFEMVTATGQVVTASQSENPDLFWALRGGGGNFGIVTSLEYRTYPGRQVLAGMLLHPGNRAAEVLRFFGEFTAKAPDELGAMAVLVAMPDLGPAAGMAFSYWGDLEEGMRVLEPARRFGPPLVDTVHPMDYGELLSLFDQTAPDGRHYHDAAYSLKTLSNQAIDGIVASAAARTSPFSAVLIHRIHGAATRLPRDATAFALRYPHYVILNSAAWEEGDGQPHADWAEAARARMAPYAAEGVYINFLGDDGEQAVRASYGANYRRLVEIKQRYDPENFFRLNQNIRPVPGAS